jgi:hypothetical protein
LLAERGNHPKFVGKPSAQFRLHAVITAWRRRIILEAAMSKSLRERLLLAGATCALAACGGGGGGAGLSSTPPPPPPPATKVCADGSVIPATDACPPPPQASPAIFSNVTTNTDFAVLGLEASALNTAADTLARDGFSVRYDAASLGYVVDLPSTEPFRFQSDHEDPSYWHGFANNGWYGGTIVDIFKPTSTNPEIQLAYTSFGTTNGYYAPQFGFVAFGQATPQSGVPVTGSATYNGLIAGRPLDQYAVISGAATFQFNYGAGTLAGRMDPVFEYDGVRTNLGTYNFVNTVFGTGSATFSGRLSNSGTANLGSFEGRFTGPAAEELMARWAAPYRNPSTQQWNEMFGVIVGRRQ